MKKSELDRTIDAIEAKKAALQMVLDELKSHRRPRPAGVKRPRAVPVERQP